MKYRQLGNTDLNISEISIGCSGFWGNRHFSEKKASAVINEAFERGINFFDKFKFLILIRRSTFNGY